MPGSLVLRWFFLLSNYMHKCENERLAGCVVFNFMLGAHAYAFKSCLSRSEVVEIAKFS